MSANRRPFLLGLTGGIATGKTTASATLRELGAHVIDADEISRSLTAEGGEALPAIREVFGDDVFCANGTLNRSALGRIVFADQQRRNALESIIHPAIQRRMMDEIDRAAQAEETLCVLTVPLMFETGMDALCDRIWVTTVDPATQLQRVMQRDNLDAQQAQARIDSQMNAEEREQRADLLIRTDRSMQDTAREITKRYNELLSGLQQ
ncbi:dephospho-CoA kinase [Eubacteriales bacterium OttesenSCG-928-N13]|nr:dephospho-CoA kinase [Eubacteriales bacterium OttesenSCG-928-N13]